MSPAALLEATAPWLNAKNDAVLYVATDEQDLAWFAPLRARHTLRFLQDFTDETQGLPSELLGMVEQVATRAFFIWGEKRVGMFC